MREKIITEALQKYLQNGIKDFSMQKLADAMGISTKTFYRYFKNKEELLQEVLIFYHTAKLKEVASLIHEKKAIVVFLDVWKKAFMDEYNVNKAFFGDLHKYYPSLAKRTEQEVGEKFEIQMNLILQNGIDDGDFRNDIIPQLVIKSIFKIFWVITREKYYSGENYTIDQILKNTLGIYIKGICTPKGLDLLEEYIQFHRKNKSFL